MWQSPVNQVGKSTLFACRGSVRMRRASIGLDYGTEYGSRILVGCPFEQSANNRPKTVVHMALILRLGACQEQMVQG